MTLMAPILCGRTALECEREGFIGVRIAVDSDRERSLRSMNAILKASIAILGVSRAFLSEREELVADSMATLGDSKPPVPR